MVKSSASVSGVVLCGGRSTRMGGVDKGLKPLRGRPMVEWVLGRFVPQVDEVLIIANQNLNVYDQLGHRVIPDVIGGFAGPHSPACIERCARRHTTLSRRCPAIRPSCRTT